MSSAGHLSPCKWAGCTTTCSSDKALNEHLLQRHSAPWRKSQAGPDHRLACEWAGCTTQPSRKWLSVHFTSHSNYRPFACNVSPSCSMRFKTWPVLERHLRRKDYHGASLGPGQVLPDLESDPDDGDHLGGEIGEDDSHIAAEDEDEEEDANYLPGGLGRTRRAKRARTPDDWAIGDNDEDIIPASSTRNAKRLQVRAVTAESEDEEAIIEEAVAHEDDDDVPSPAFEPSKSPAVVSPEQEDDPSTSTPIKGDCYANLFPERLYADASSSPSHASFESPSVVIPEQEIEPESADGEDEDWNTDMILDAQPTTDDVDSAAEDPEDWSLV